MTDRTTPNFERTASALHKFVVDFRCIAPFLNTANQMDWVQPNFGLLPPPPLCENYGRDERSVSVLQA